MFEDFRQQIPPSLTDGELDREWLQAVMSITQGQGNTRKILVLDDDPTGTQTVHSVPVYTNWDLETLRQIMRNEHTVVYILTNSRALTTKQTEELHRDLIRCLKQASGEVNQEFILISRSDSTLRGHYPLETQVIYQELTADDSDSHIDGEIIIPFFFEGGRITFNDVHYVKNNEGNLLPTGRSEFARDSTFGYHASNLREWVEEKTGGKYKAENVKSISLDLLRQKKINEIEEILLSVNDFGKLVVNSAEPNDLKVFLIALGKAMLQGKRYIYRTAASFVQTIGGIRPRSYLTKQELYPHGKSSAPGLVIAGSYVERTTRQLRALRDLPGIHWVEWQVSQARTEASLQAEVERVIREAERGFHTGKDVCIYTTRDYLPSEQAEDEESNLLYSLRVSNGLVRVVQGLKIDPGFLIAKGGISASDIGVKGLNVKQAIVMGQIKPGISVWRLGLESRFPGLPYIIFPGNVGTDDTLRSIVSLLR